MTSFRRCKVAGACLTVIRASPIPGLFIFLP
ncbi:hypothetical protein [Arthrobacter sp. NIO-1057]